MPLAVFIFDVFTRTMRVRNSLLLDINLLIFSKNGKKTEDYSNVIFANTLSFCVFSVDFCEDSHIFKSIKCLSA